MNDKTTNEAKPTGSPVTTATPGNEVKGSPVTAASSDKSNNAPNNAAPGPQSTKTLTPSGTAVKTPEGDEKPKNEVSDNTTEDPAPEISREEEAKLESILDGEAEDDGRMNADGSVKIGDDDPDYMKAGKTAWNKIVRITSIVPKDTPDEHVVWGAGGVVLTLGDLRALVKRG
jgi:hypothetical protein